MSFITAEVETICVAKLVAAGFEEGQATQLLQDAEILGMLPDDLKEFQKYFRNEDSDIDLKKVDAFMHLQTVRMTYDSYKPVLEKRAQETDHEISIEKLRTIIAKMHEAEYTGQEIATVCNGIKISKSFTSHPTEGLSPNGIELTRALVEAAETRTCDRKDKIKEILIEMIETDDFGASSRSNMVDEIDYGTTCARIHNDGANIMDRTIEDVIYQITGEAVDIRTNTAARSWDYDADGKPNAEGFAMMLKISATTIGALEDLAKNLDRALPGLNNDETRKTVQKLSRQTKSVIEKLKPVYERTREIVIELAEAAPDERAVIYKQHYDQDYQDLFRKLATIYDHLDNHRGYDFYTEMKETLPQFREDILGNNVAYWSIDNSYRTLRRCGFALDKGQTRHNDLVYIRMLDRLFEQDAFWDLSILPQEDREEIMQAGHFSDLSNEKQYEYWESILDYAKKNGNRGRIIEILEQANPLTFKPSEEGGNGYPDQERTYIDRMALRALFSLKFEEGIISDAQEIASPRQKFLADLFGIEDMKHMSLNEDMDTLARQHRLTTNFNVMGGAESMETRAKKMPEHFRREHETLHVMRPASDAERNGGSFTRLQALDQYRRIVREAYDMRVPIEIMIGGGQSLNRFGGDVSIVRRVVAQELQNIYENKKEEGKELDEYDEKMIIMAKSILYTEQGRTRRYASATPNQVSDDFTAKLVGILQDYMELKDDVLPGTFIDPRHEFSEDMDKLQRNTADEAIVHYNKFANLHATGPNGHITDELLLNRFVQQAGCPNLTPFQNNGARPAAGKAKSAKNVSGLRAIGKDQALYTMQAFHAGFFASGRVMIRFHTALREGKIDQDDVNALIESPDWNEAIFSRNLIDAGRFNATHLFAQLTEESSPEWTFDRAVAIGRQVSWIREADGKRCHLLYEGSEDVTQEQLYLCKIYYDRLVFLSMIEASLNPDGSISMNSDLDDIINNLRPKDNGLEFGLGEKTKEKWPDIETKILPDHQKNAPAYAMYYLIEEDIAQKAKKGQSPGDIMGSFGDGNPQEAEIRFRKYGAAVRAGTLPHKDKWMGSNTYGLENRRAYDVQQPPSLPATAHLDCT